jgi:hypothetical protein
MSQIFALERSGRPPPNLSLSVIGNKINSIQRWGFSGIEQILFWNTLDFSFVTVYGYKMTKREKLFARAMSNPKGLSFGEFQTLLRQAGWTFDHQRGSHRIWYSPTGYRLSAQESRSGKAKGYQVEQFLRQYEVENEKI